MVASRSSRTTSRAPRSIYFPVLPRQGNHLLSRKYSRFIKRRRPLRSSARMALTFVGAGGVEVQNLAMSTYWRCMPMPWPIGPMPFCMYKSATHRAVVGEAGAGRDERGCNEGGFHDLSCPDSLLNVMRRKKRSSAPDAMDSRQRKTNGFITLSFVTICSAAASSAQGR